MKIRYIFLFYWLSVLSFTNLSFSSESDVIIIKKTTDFDISGIGSARNWNKTKWVYIEQRRKSDTIRSTRIKILYSEIGIYFLFSCEDTRLTAMMNANYMPLWKEDVVEICLAPDPDHWNHFEYELSPLNYELALFVTKNGNSLTRWLPFYDREREMEKTRHATAVIGDQKRGRSIISSWMAEFYIPFRLLCFFDNAPPQEGTKWRGNIYRVDYDQKPSVDWTWQPVSGSYHNVDEYGIFLFE